MNRYIPKRIDSIEEYTPVSGDYRIRLDANESPFAPPAAVLSEFASIINGIEYNRYPDSSASALTAAFARAYGQAAENVVAGNGSDELISVIINAFLSEGDTLLVAAPDFSMYEFYGALRGVRVVSAPKTEDHGIDFDAMLRMIEEEKASAVIFSNPCNPTGRAYDRETVIDFVSRANTLVILDEAYADFCEFGCSLLDICAKRDNLIILRTLSKAFGLASMRVGFAVTNGDIASAIRKVKSPYNVNSVTQAFAAAVLNHKPEYDAQKDEILIQKKRMHARLCDLSEKYSFTVYGSDTNFVFARFYEGGAKQIFDELAKRGIKIRCMPPYLRITAGMESETNEFLRVLEQILAQTQK